MTKAEQLAQELRQKAGFHPSWAPDFLALLRAAADELEKGAKDSARLDWLETGESPASICERVAFKDRVTRRSVDAAMSAEPSAQTQANEEGER